ncbi:MAG: hypothetical protein GWQ08_04300 [Verrucomicrobiaceae bacterium]|nr:hypothetical protein [Verrucomicrobiaceae bacterium]
MPVSVAPEFGNWIGNLEFMPQTLNRRKSDKMGERQRAMLGSSGQHLRNLETHVRFFW